MATTGDLVLTEVLQGFASSKDFDQARDLLTALIVIDLGGREIGISLLYSDQDFDPFVKHLGLRSAMFEE